MSGATRHDLHLPDGMNYECIQCGRSCGEFWEIKVTPDEARSIRERAPEDLKAAGAADPSCPVIDSPWTPGRLIMRADARKTCCLQGPDGLCTLHKKFGFFSKPNICRSFPYKFIETPHGVYCGLTFACTAVLNNLGPALSAQRESVEDLFSWTHSRRAIEAPPGLTGSIPISWQQYDAIEQDLTELIGIQNEPISERLLMQYLYLHLLIKLVREARESKSLQTAGPEANDDAFAVFRNRIRQDDFQLLRQMKSRRPKSGLLRRVFLGVAHELRNTYGRRTGRLRGYAKIFLTYFAYGIGRGSIDMPALSRPVRYQNLRSIAFDPARPEFDALLTRYFRHRLERKDLLTADSIQFGMQLQMMQWGLIHWYAAAIAADRGAREVEWEHLIDAVRIVEKYFVLHSTFEQLFQRMPLMRLFLDRLLEHPLYAFTLARPEF
ncbi:hypothetical protein LLG95_01180 [bacterium]|nr:hypothetical protein [bacterium]